MGIVSKRLRASAKGRECTMRTPYCNHNPETTVLAHLPSPVKGMATKSDDYWAVFACSSCHAAMDEHKLLGMTARYQLDALQRTQKIWFEEGYLTIVGDDKEPKPRHSKKSLPPRPIGSGSPGGKS
jgi:hypothetical protein